MSPLSPHPFLELDESERVYWIARFLDNPAAKAPYDLDFPVLRREEQPFSWLINQFRLVRQTKDLPDRVRRPVVDLVLNEGGRDPVRNRAQFLGELLEIVGACEFTDKEIVEALPGWVRNDLYKDAWYQVFGNRLSVRRKVWSLLIGWRQTNHGLIDSLRRDFQRSLPEDPPGARPELDCAQICFAELGRLSPADAIELIPKVFSWPEPYWREVLRRFFTSLEPRQVTAERYRSAWERCFAEIVWDTGKLVFLEVPSQDEKLFIPQDGKFTQLLREVDLCYRRSEENVVRIQPTEPGAPGLEIDVEPYRLAVSNAMTEEFAEAFA